MVDVNNYLYILQIQFGSCIMCICVFFPFIYLLNYIFTSDTNDIIGNGFSWDFKTIIFSIIIGSLVCLGNLCVMYGYKIGDSTKVVWLEYINLIFAYGIQWIAFGRIRNMYEVIGAILIVSTVFIQLYVQYNEYIKEKLNKKDKNKKAPLVLNETL
mmetsp:Transcript_4025/g.5023  ORF Transcript_4025/g.5023 Transcript_4025/m.5023 type:complete len:156 (+) Transcript_4025:3-470(+)